MRRLSSESYLWWSTAPVATAAYRVESRLGPLIYTFSVPTHACYWWIWRCSFYFFARSCMGVATPLNSTRFVPLRVTGTVSSAFPVPPSVSHTYMPLAKHWSNSETNLRDFFQAFSSDSWWNSLNFLIRISIGTAIRSHTVWATYVK
jgi:hypothetical protein